MPAFETLSSEQARDIAAFLHAVIDDSRKRKSMDVNAIVVGDRAEGAAFFNGDGKCRSCHNPNTDFKGIGSKYDPYVCKGA